MTTVIKTHAGYGLAHAKACTDAVLDGKTIEIEVPNDDVAHTLAAELTALNAIARVV